MQMESEGKPIQRAQPKLFDRIVNRLGKFAQGMANWDSNDFTMKAIPKTRLYVL